MGGWSQVLLSKIMSLKEADDYSIIMCEKTPYMWVGH